MRMQGRRARPPMQDQTEHIIMSDKTTKILFQGDSITDAGRSRDAACPANAGLGTGYPHLIAGKLLSLRPQRGYQFTNRGISGNRVVDLYARWKSDALNLAPDLISILIGVNDTWHEFGSSNGVEVDRYAVVYRMLLEWTRKALPKTKLVICEPFVLPIGAVAQAWLPEMEARRAVCAQLAGDFDAPFVPFQAMFTDAVKEAPDAYWLGDGVHPTVAGHMRMADLWIKTTQAIL